MAIIMNNEGALLVIGIIIFVYLIGYLLGYKHGKPKNKKEEIENKEGVENNV